MRPRLGLTTSIERIESLRRHVEMADLEPVALPCIEVTPADRRVLVSARRLAETCDWLVVTSSRTIDILWPGGGMPPVPTATVGETTAAAVESAGGKATLVGDGRARDLVNTLAGLVEGASVYFPHGASADVTHLRQLEAVAGGLETTAVYETKPVPPTDQDVDAVAFGSPSAVAGWFEARDVEGLVVAAIGPTTALALEERGVGDLIVPERPSFPDLAFLLAAYLRQRSVI